MIHPLRIAHRGASGTGLAPENTLAALELAIQTGVDLIEIDVRASADGQIVVIHDATLERTTDAQGAVQDLPLETIRRADAGGWFAPEFAGERVPLLEEVLDLARHRAVVLIEIKAAFIAERVLQIVEYTAAEDYVVLQAFSPRTVERVKRLSPATPAALLVGKLPTAPSRLRARRLARDVLQTGANTLAVWHATLTPPFFEEMRKRGLAVWAWTVDEEVAMRDLIEMGIQGLISNYPDRLNRVLAEMEEEGLIQMPLGRHQRLKRSRWARRRQIKRLRRYRGD